MGRNYVADPGVDHSGTAQRFVVERVYANDSTNDNWMEAGWAEHWSRDDQQYIYEYDSATQTWHYFDQYTLSVGSSVETEVYYSSSFNKWRALYHIGGVDQHRGSTHLVAEVGAFIQRLADGVRHARAGTLGDSIDLHPADVRR